MRSAWNDPAMPYYLISVLVLVTVALGLVFVLSSSAVKSLSRGNAPYDEFFGQAQFALIGLPLAFAVSRLPVDFLKKFSWTNDDQNQVASAIADGKTYDEAAQAWIEQGFAHLGRRSTLPLEPYLEGMSL